MLKNYEKQFLRMFQLPVTQSSVCGQWSAEDDFYIQLGNKRKLAKKLKRVIKPVYH